MSLNRDTVSAEIKAKRNTSKAHYDKTAGPEQNSINIGEFVYARPMLVQYCRTDTTREWLKRLVRPVQVVKQWFTGRTGRGIILSNRQWWPAYH